jgi:uncharacterized OB-fold protein
MTHPDTRTAQRPPDSLFTLVTDQWTQPWWDAAAKGQLVAAKCGNCGKFRMPPSPFCPHCRSQAIEWMELPGTGTLYSHTVVERAILPELADCIPYVPAVVEPDGAPGIRFITNIVGSAIQDIVSGSKVAVLFDPIPGGAIPRFRIVKDAAV